MSHVSRRGPGNDIEPSPRRLIQKRNPARVIYPSNQAAQEPSTCHQPRLTNRLSQDPSTAVGCLSHRARSARRVSRREMVPLPGRLGELCAAIRDTESLGTRNLCPARQRAVRVVHIRRAYQEAQVGGRLPRAGAQVRRLHRDGSAWHDDSRTRSRPPLYYLY